jgi:hypothetical protein
MALNDNRVRVEEAPSIVFEVFICGDINQAKHFLTQMAADTGMCVSVDETEYVYTGGREKGMVVRIINYPRFPSTEHELEEFAHNVALSLMGYLGQQSCSVIGPRKTTWFSRRDE